MEQQQLGVANTLKGDSCWANRWGLFLLPAPCSYLAWLIFLPCSWRRDVAPKHWLTFKRLQSIISQKTELSRWGKFVYIVYLIRFLIFVWVMSPTIRIEYMPLHRAAFLCHTWNYPHENKTQNKTKNKTNKHTCSTELSPSWEANSCLANQKIPRILWNLKVDYHGHKNPPMVSILSQINWVHNPPILFHYDPFQYHPLSYV
jgi:hypothetical protein